MGEVKIHPELTEIFKKLASGEANWQERLKAVRYALTGTFTPSKETQKKQFGEFAIDYKAAKNSKLGDLYADYSFPIDSEDGQFLGECGLTLEGGHLEIWMFDKLDIKTGKIVYFFGEKNRPSKLDNSVDPEKVIDFLSLSPNEEVVVIETNSLNLSIRFEDVVFEYKENGGIEKIDRFSAKIHVSRKDKSTP